MDSYIEVKPPTKFSYSSLKKIENCPKQWALSTVSPSVFGKSRLHRATFVGTIIHEVFSEIVLELVSIGSPFYKSPAGKKVLLTPPINQRVLRFIEGWCAENVERYSITFDLQDPRMIFEITNEVVSRVRRDYNGTSTEGTSLVLSGDDSSLPLLERLRRCPILSEVELIHPNLPYVGYADLIEMNSHGDVCIIDVKTGKSDDAHIVQVKTYALLFWRMTDVLPMSWKLSYNGKEIAGSIVEAELVQLESKMENDIANAQSISGPVNDQKANTSEACRWCFSRGRCDEYWAAPETIRQSDCSLIVYLPLRGHFFTVEESGNRGLLRNHEQLKFLLKSNKEQVNIRIVNPKIRFEQDSKIFEVKVNTEIYAS